MATTHRGVRAIALVCAIAVSCSMLAQPGAEASGVALGLDPRVTKVLRSLAGHGGDVSIAESPDVGDTPGSATPLPVGPVDGALSRDADPVDVYSVTLADGDRIGVTLIGDATLNADVFLFAPGTTDILTSAAVSATIGDGYPRSLTYRIDQDGTHYLAVAAAAGAGEYTIKWYAQPWNADGDSDIPGQVAASPVAGTLDATTDPDDVYAITVAEGQRLVATLDSWDLAVAPELYVFGPTAESVLTAVPLAAAVGGAARTVSIDVPVGSGAAGTYYVDVRAGADAGAYQLSWSVGAIPAGAWKNVGDAVALPPSSVTDSLDGVTAVNRVYRIDLSAGQRLTLDLTSPTGADFDLYVYPIGTTNIHTALPVSWSDLSMGVDSVIVDALVSGRYWVEVRQFHGSGQYALDWAVGSSPQLGDVQRLWGNDRYATAMDISRQTFSPGACPTVVLATGADFADALAASGLAGAYRSPVLLTKPTSLPVGLVTEMRRLGASTVVIVGGPKAVSDGVESALRSAGFATNRVPGDDRYATAAAVAGRIRTVMGPREELPGFIVRGDLYPDALAAAPIAYRGAYPVLLSRSTSLPDATRQAITASGVDEIVIAGGEVAVSSGVAEALEGVAGVRTVHRESGGDRYGTAVALAAYATRMWWSDNSYVGVATGMDFPDALGGGAAAGYEGGVILLTKATSLPSQTTGYLSAHKSEVRMARIYGGATAVTDAVRQAVTQALAGDN